MKKLFYVLFLAAGLASCAGGNQGELTGVANRPVHYSETPLGMVVVKEGSFNMGASDQDISYAQTSRTKTVSMDGFYMDETEITNNEYRQFVYYVRDSLIRRYALQEGYVDAEMGYFKTQDEFGMELADLDFDEETYPIDWDMSFSWYDLTDVEEDGKQAILEEFYLQGEENIDGGLMVDSRKLMFNFAWFDMQRAAGDKERRVSEGKELGLGQVSVNGEDNFTVGHIDRSEFVINEYINVYPDTLVWIHDFAYAYNEPFAENYFSHPAYDDYPVVGITWKQAIAFGYWRTQMKNDYLKSVGAAKVARFRLPTEAEWEYAARGGKEGNPFPWGGPYSRNQQGCFLANFKPLRGRYHDDGGMKTVKADSYHPNDYGLYNMSGNVAEWTSTSYDDRVHDEQNRIARARRRPP